MSVTVILLLVAAYLLGSVPSSHLAGRWAGVDLTRRGSGNLGATNVFRVVGWKAALPVVLADVGKGFVPAWFFPAWDGSGAGWLALGYGLGAILGHVRSAFVGFRGGKGVATSGGVLLALAPVTVAVGLLVWVGVTLLTRIVSVASLAAATVVPLVAFLFDAPGETVGFAAALALLVWWTHRENLGRLARGEELRFGETRPDPAAPEAGGGGAARAEGEGKGSG